MDHEYNVSEGYVPSFTQHLKDTGARLGLRVRSEANSDQASRAGAVQEVAETYTHSSWMPAERDAFFRALSVYSRWRPDLIAACIPTRAEWEVWMYLEALEEGAATLALQRGGEDMNMEGGPGGECHDVDMPVDRPFLYSHLHSNFDMDEDKGLCEPALEVSQAWIDAEERMASWIVQEEHLASVESDAVASTEDVDDEPPKRKRGRPRSPEKGRAQRWARGRTVCNEGCHSTPPDQRSPSLESSSMTARKREMLMGRLEVPHLLVLDGILREGEEAMKEKSKSREDSMIAATPTEHTDGGVFCVRAGGVAGLSHGTTAPEGINDVSQSSDVVINPVLLALSGGVDPAGRQSGQVPSEGAWTGGASAHAPTQGPSSLLDASSQPALFKVPFQPGIGSMISFPPGSVALTNPILTTNAELDLSLFSPRSRRRIQKRLYMRRKRASLRRNGIASEDAVYTGVERLKPGKKAKSKRNETPAISTSVPCSEAPSDAEMKLSENVSKKNKSGLTLPYKLKARFTRMSIDAGYLRSQGMDLLNLNALGKLMRLYSSLEHGEEEADDSAIALSIDAELIRHLQAAMVTFVTDIIHRVIVWKERETRLKQRSRAWRHGDQITVGAIEHAIEAIGARYHSHKEYLDSLEAFHYLDTEGTPVPANTSETDPADVYVDSEVEAVGRSAEAPGLPLHRDVYTPVVHPPSVWKMSPLTSLARTYEREATRTRRGTGAEIGEDELMSDETDEEALEAELEEEEEADVWDMELGARYEEGLWDAVEQ